jgi:hypothetical protein
MKKIVALVLVLVSLSTVLFAEEKEMAPVTMTSTRDNGRGGPHIAYTNDIKTLFVNPGALQWVNQGEVLEISPAFAGPLDKIIGSGSGVMDPLFSLLKGEDLPDGINPFEGLTDMMADGRLPLGIELRGPFNAGYVANGLGIGLFNRVFLDARVIGTDIDADAYADVILNYGMSFNIVRLKDHALTAGFALRPFVRVMTSMETSVLDLAGKKDFDIAVPLIAGGGVDLGLLYRFKRDLAFGFTADDVYTAGVKMSDLYGKSPSDTLYRVPYSLNVGLSYTFHLADVWETAPQALQLFYAAAMLDWHRLNHVFSWNDHTHRNPILDLGVGLELGFFNILKLRLGIYDMLPSAGIGVELAAFKIDFSAYGKELGNEPGRFTTTAYDLSISVRPGTERKRWPWSKALVY